jgi:hypothetical protein
MNRIIYLLLFLFMSCATVLTTGCSDDTSCTDGIKNGNETGVDCGGDCPACISCEDGIQNGDEEGVDCGGTDCEPCEVGAHGQWQSSGTNVAPLLVNFFAVDSIWASFKTDGTYEVHQFDITGAKTILTGTFTQMESGVNDIWTITVNQSSPANLTSEGILKITGDEMKYEIAQTEPDIGATPPTPAGGFGSTSGGAFGTSNVQTYIRIN